MVDDWHGTRVPDPYRWLEQLDSPATRAWVGAEDHLTKAVMSRLPLRAALRKRIAVLDDYQRYDIPFQASGRLFYTRNTGLQNQPVLYMQVDAAVAPVVALDPNALSRDGSVVVEGYVASHDGQLLAYGVSEAGSDWTQWRVRDLRTGKDLADVLRYTKYYRPVFAHDDRGLYYSAFPAPAKGQELSSQDLGNAVYFHALGSSAPDRKLLELPGHPDWQYKVGVSDDGRWLIAATGEGEVGDKSLENLYLLDLEHPQAAARPVVEGYRAAYEYLGSDAGRVFFMTTAGAPNGKVVALDAADPHASFVTVIAEGAEPIPQSEAGESVTLVNHQLIVQTVQAAHDHVVAYGLDGHKIRDITLPGVGTVAGFDGRPGDARTYYSFTNMLTPVAVYEYDAATGASRAFHRLKLAFDPSRYEEHEVFYAAKDGARIPLQLVYRKGLKHDGSNPTVLYGYGGFGIVETPTFEAARIAWLEHGGIYAIANIRGGGEYGERWHQAANLHRKQVVFDDFIGAAEWLIAQRYTSTPHLAIEGASNGGLLIGACLTQRPDLYGAAIAKVGVMDMLRFNRFGQGAGWMGEYGDPANASDFKALYAYSPLHNVRPAVYPATLVVTGDHDTRVMPGHSFKFAAALQAAQQGRAPVLLYVEDASGHGGGANVSQYIAQNADIYAFLAQNLGLK